VKTWAVTVAFAAAATLHLVRACRTSKDAAGEVLHALMGVAMAAMAWMVPSGHVGGHGALAQILAVAFFLGAVWAVLTRAPASCLMALGMSLVFTPVD
jgi:hypothetical protein